MDNEFILTTPISYEIKSNGDLEVIGEISTTHPDLVNDIVSLACLKSMQRQIQEGNLKIDLEHEAFRGDTNEEKELNKTKVPIGRMVEPTITEKKTDEGIQHGLSVKVLFNKASERFAAVKSNIVNKFLDAFSIAYIPTESRRIMKKGEEFRVLEDLRLLNTALTGNPVNTTAQMSQVITKSLDALEQYKEDKKSNPELSDKLEVKTSDASRNARNDAISGEDEDEEEETKKKKKYEKKAYEKDGGHSHETDAIGEHNHPEIEKEISRLWDFIFEMGRPTEEIVGKSHSNEKFNIIQKEVKMTEENENAAPKVEESQVEESKKEAAESNEVLNEVKSLIASLKSDMESRFNKLESKDDEVEAPKKEAKSKVLGAENSDSQNLKAEGKTVAAGLSLIR